MTIWILAALVGGLLLTAGYVNVVRRYRRGEVGGPYLLTVGAGGIAFVAYALLSAIAPTVVNGVLTLLLLLPAFVAIVILVREHERNGRARRSAE